MVSSFFLTQSTVPANHIKGQTMDLRSSSHHRMDSALRSRLLLASWERFTKARSDHRIRHQPPQPSRRTRTPPLRPRQRPLRHPRRSPVDHSINTATRRVRLRRRRLLPRSVPRRSGRRRQLDPTRHLPSQPSHPQNPSELSATRHSFQALFLVLPPRIPAR